MMSSVHFNEESIYLNKDFFLIDIQLIYKVLLVSSGQHNDLVIHTYISKKKNAKWQNGCLRKPYK